jgi:hypothetical protein
MIATPHFLCKRKRTDSCAEPVEERRILRNAPEKWGGQMGRVAHPLRFLQGVGIPERCELRCKKRKPRDLLGAFKILNDACHNNRNSQPNRVKHENSKFE